MVYKSHFEGQNSNEAQELARLKTERYMLIQAEALQIAFDNDEKTISAWLSDQINADNSRDIVQNYLVDHEEVDILELAGLIKQKITETQILH